MRTRALLAAVSLSLCACTPSAQPGPAMPGGSGAADDWPIIDMHSVDDGDAPISLSDWYTGYFTPGGAYYSATANFSKAAPGTAFAYSNQASALTALIAERITGVPFDQWCKQRIFT